MANAKISALPSATVPLAGTEVLPVVQGGTTDKVTAADLLRQNGQTVTTSNPVLSLAQTWNAGAVAFTGLLFNATNTASAAGSLLLDLQVGGTSQFKVDRTGTGIFTGNVGIGTTDPRTKLTITDGGSPYGTYTGLMFDIRRAVSNGAANSNVSLRLGNNSNTFDIKYGGTTDRLVFVAGGVVEVVTFLNNGNVGIGTTAPASLLHLAATSAPTMRLDNGTISSTSAYQFYTGSSLEGGMSHVANTGTLTISSGRSVAWGGRIVFEADTVEKMRITSTGTLLADHLVFGTDNTYDIGSSGVTRPRNIYLGSSAFVGSALYLGASTTNIAAPSDGVLRLQNGAGTDFTRLQFGGTTSSFPAIARNAAEIDFKLADNSALCGINVGSVASYGGSSAYVGTAIPAGGTAGAGFKVSSTANFGVFFGSGAPTLSAAKGSLYLRSDGSGATDRFYINTDGGTTWTAGTTVL